MDSEFNPYVEWLEIDPALCPPNFYDLLGITPFEEDPHVIEQALASRLAHVRTFQTGPRGKHTQELLNELARARLCLMDPKSRAEYNDFLRGGLSKPPVLVDNLSGDDLPPVDPNAIQIASAEEPDQSSPGTSQRSTKMMIIYVASCLTLVLIVWGITAWSRGGNGDETPEANEAELAKQEADSTRKKKPRTIINSEEVDKGILPGANNSFILKAQNAKIDQPHPELIDTSDGQLLAKWQPAQSKVRWEIWINTPGYYEAIVSYNATTNDSFSRFIVETDQDFSKKTKMRQAEKLDRFFEEEVVVLFRKPGRRVIHFQVEGDCGDFRLQSITLRPNRITRE